MESLFSEVLNDQPCSTSYWFSLRKLLKFETSTSDITGAVNNKLQIPSQSYDEMDDSELIQLVMSKRIAVYNLEKLLNNNERAVKIRREYVCVFHLKSQEEIKSLPYLQYPYEMVHGSCCENVIGYATIPVGIVGPLILNSKSHHIPFATTEGCLVASANRGCACIRSSVGKHPKANGVVAHIVDDGMTRGPILTCPSIAYSKSVSDWLRDSNNFAQICNVFNSTTNYGTLSSVKCKLVGKLLFMRFKARTGEAMGMNMVSKGVQRCLNYLLLTFPEVSVVSLSGNYCTDKKSSSLNWVLGRGKSVSAEVVIDHSSLLQTLKCPASKLVKTHIAKNMVGSSMAGTLGGNNAHAANVVAAIFAATGQDIAQVVDSSMCLLHMEVIDDDALYVSCAMPCIEVGVVGGGTGLPSQSACLKLMDLWNNELKNDEYGKASHVLAMIICGAVLAAEISLLASMVTGDLVKQHLKMNRKCSEDKTSQNCNVL